MEWCFSSSEEMIQRAKEELEILETEHPNRFLYLKLDLKSLILLLQSSQQQPPSSSIHYFNTSIGYKEEEGDESDRVDLVLKRAESCLYKIRKLKSALC